MARRPPKDSERRAQAIAAVHEAYAKLSEWWDTVEINVVAFSEVAGNSAYSLETPGEPPDEDNDDPDEDGDGEEWKSTPPSTDS